VTSSVGPAPVLDKMMQHTPVYRTHRAKANTTTRIASTCTSPTTANPALMRPPTMNAPATTPTPGRTPSKNATVTNTAHDSHDAVPVAQPSCLATAVFRTSYGATPRRTRTSATIDTAISNQPAHNTATRLRISRNRVLSNRLVAVASFGEEFQGHH
jgi:hypothetical protein